MIVNDIKIFHEEEKDKRCQQDRERYKKFMKMKKKRPAECKKKILYNAKKIEAGQHYFQLNIKKHFFSLNISP